MKSFVAFALPLLAAAAPAINKRQVVTDVSTVFETEIVATQTVWVDGPLPTSTEAAVSHHTSKAAPPPSTFLTSAPPIPTSVPASTPSSTSVYVAPTTSSSSAAAWTPPASTPTTSAAPAWTPSSTPPAPASTAAAPSSGGSSSGGSSALGSGPFTGDLTAYVDAGALACGGSFSEDSPIVAISHTTFDQFTPGGNPNNNPLCGTSITLTYNGQPFQATIQDRCTGCNPGDLDLPEGFWSTVTGGQPYGRLDVSWTA